MMLVGENAREVSLAVSEKLAQVQKYLLLGIKLTAVYDHDFTKA